MRRQMATVGTCRSDSLCADAVSVCGADTGVANWIGACSDSKHPHTNRTGN